MKKQLLTTTLLAMGVVAVAVPSFIGSAPVSSSTEKSIPIVTKNDNHKVSQSLRLPSESNVGVSIGAVVAIPYEEAGVNFNSYYTPAYVAQISENTYLGFDLNADYADSPSASLTHLSSTEENITIPDYIIVEGIEIPVETFLVEYCNFTENIKTLTIPSTINFIQSYYRFDQYMTDIYMLGPAPDYNSYYNLTVPNIHICNSKDMASYLSNNYFPNANLMPYGWDYEWITINVEKAGEFAETYLTQNDYDWGAAFYVKVTGNINDIDLSAIKKLTSLQKLDLSETEITSLPESFMSGRNTLEEVKLPKTVTEIGGDAFYGCSRLKSFDMQGIKTIKSCTFYGCSALSYINLTGVDIIESSSFQGCSNLENIDLSTVKSLGTYAFRNCSKLTSVDLSSVASINYGAFEDCNNLKEIVLSTNVKEIESYSFCRTALQKIVLPSSVEKIDDGVFADCKELTDVTLNSGLLSIGSDAFKGCTALEEITIPATVNKIENGAFNNTAITTFKCFAAVPPAASSSFIGKNMDMTRTFLYVPPFSKDFYRNTEYWCDFYLMRSLEEPVDYILVDRELTINLNEEDNDAVANNPTMDLTVYEDKEYYYNYKIGQLTATGEGTLSAGQFNVTAQLANRNSDNYFKRCPTLINYADKMRADNVTHNLIFPQEYYNSGIWHFISLPYDVKVSEIVPSDNTYWVIRRYDSEARAAGETSTTWVDLTNNDVLEAGKGYIISTVREKEYDENGAYLYPSLTLTSGNSITKNNIFRSTDVIIPLAEYPAEFAHNRSWNFIGNPYPCYFDMHYLNEEFTAPVTVWNGSNYVAYSPVDDDLVLSPYEAFFVQCPLDATEVIFQEEGRMHAKDGRSLYKQPERVKENITLEERNVFNFIIDGENYSDRTRIVFNQDADNDYEIGRDASKFFADNNENAQIYVHSNVNYSITERPVNDGTAVLGLRSEIEKTYTMSLGGKFSKEWHVLLTDNLTGKVVDLTEEDYVFTSESKENDSRFSIQFRLGENITNGIPSLISKFGNTNITVTALNGMVVFSGNASEINVPAAGIYLISNGEEIIKMILNK